MGELISIREASRRIGVSDTAVQKAIKTGRVKIAGRTEKSNRPLVSWPDVADDWAANTDSMKRSHAGTKPGSVRDKENEGIKPVVELGTSGNGGGSRRREAGIPTEAPMDIKGPNYAASRAIREAYSARLLKLEHDEKIGKLVSIETIHVEAFKTHRKIRDALMNMPDRLAPELAAMNDPVEIQIYMSKQINDVLRALSSDIYNKGNNDNG